MGSQLPRLGPAKDKFALAKQPLLFDEELAQRFDREQGDLDSLCADRELETPEAFAQNDYYGIAHLLKAYAGVEPSRSIRAVIPHGPYFNDDQVIQYERDADVPAAFVYPAYRDVLYSELGSKLVVPFSSPFVYADLLVKHRGKRAGTLFYPAHSTHRLTAVSDYEALADSLLDWPSERGPLRVMVYWRDYLLGHHVPFMERGISLVSAGHIFDPDFLLRQAYLLKQHEHVASNGLGSHMLYAIHAGCSVEYVAHEHSYSGDEEHLKTDAPALSYERQLAVENMKRLFSQRLDAPSEEQRSLSAEYLRTDALMSAPEMADLFAWLERVYRRGRIAVIVDRGERFGVLMPRTLRVVRHRGLRDQKRVLLRLEMGLRSVVSGAIAALRRVLPFLENVRVRR